MYYKHKMYMGHSPKNWTKEGAFSPSLISRTVSVDVKHHVYFLIY